MSEPMSDERLAELEKITEDRRYPLPNVMARELVAEIKRARGELEYAFDAGVDAGVYESNPYRGESGE